MCMEFRELDFLFIIPGFIDFGWLKDEIDYIPQNHINWYDHSWNCVRGNEKKIAY